MTQIKKFTDKQQTIDLWRITTEPFGTNAYIVSCSESGCAVLVDAPGNADLLREILEDLKLQQILLTHNHMDHTIVLEELYREFNVPLSVHQTDAASLPVKPDHFLQDGDTVRCGNIKLAVMHTPGHTLGSLCFHVDSFLLSGDTIFPGGPGKTASPETFRKIFASIKDKLLVLPDDTLILPGHGEHSDIKTERALVKAFSLKYDGKNVSGDVTWLD